ncbi:MAG: hypothetical protein LBC17_02150 [Lactobacillaceae bacterium]|jgi:ABC-type multidrug transport system ATPase subunit|nr:hypothetical protein [Lactobacillaceae bacterium]
MRKNELVTSDLDSSNILYLGDVEIGLEELTIIENIKSVFWISGIKWNEELLKMLQKIQPDEKLNTLYKESSLGMQLLVGLSLLLSNKKWKMVILDETLSGLDVKKREYFFQILKKISQESLVVFVAHGIENVDVDFTEISVSDGGIIDGK